MAQKDFAQNLRDLFDSSSVGESSGTYTVDSTSGDDYYYPNPPSDPADGVGGSGSSLNGIWSVSTWPTTVTVDDLLKTIEKIFNEVKNDSDLYKLEGMVILVEALIKEGNTLWDEEDTKKVEALKKKIKLKLIKNLKK